MDDRALSYFTRLESLLEGEEEDPLSFFNGKQIFEVIVLCPDFEWMCFGDILVKYQPYFRIQDNLLSRLLPIARIRVH